MAGRDIVETLERLIAIPSPTGEEETLREAIAARLSAHPTTSFMDSLVVGDPGVGKVLLAGHLDTVPLQGDLGPSRRDGRIHGLGATDMKGGLAVMIHLVEALGTEDLVAVFYAGEEGPMAGNQLSPILDSEPGLSASRAGIVLEPTNRQLHAGCQGAINARVGFEGEAAHSARPWLGRNAITRAGGFLEGMGRREPLEREVGGLAFREVMSVTTAAGGVANNVIPDWFELNVNYRFAPDRDLSEAIERLRSACSEADSFEVRDAAPGAMPEMGHPLFEALAEAAGADVSSKQGWTDVAQLAARGIPAVNFGPGETDLAHKPGESVRASDLTWCFEALARVLA